MNTHLAVAAILVPNTMALLAQQSCFKGRACSAEEYCSPFSERCEKCEEICDTTSHNYHENDCSRYCPDFAKDDGLRSQIRAMQRQQKLILIIVLVLFILVLLSNTIKMARWLRRQPGFRMFVKKFSSKREKSSKEQTPGTISNVMHVHDIDRPPSQIFSVTGVEGSTVLTVTTPVSTRYPAEDSTTTTEYSYDNAALQVTPSSNKPPFPQSAY